LLPCFELAAGGGFYRAAGFDAEDAREGYTGCEAYFLDQPYCVYREHWHIGSYLGWDGFGSARTSERMVLAPIQPKGLYTDQHPARRWCRYRNLFDVEGCWCAGGVEHPGAHRLCWGRHVGSCQ
jgi:hypothetical protein